MGPSSVRIDNIVKPMQKYGARRRSPRLALLRFLLRLGLQVLLNDAEVFEVGEFHEDKITKRMLIFVE
jgi:hypothetical protein